MVARVVICVHTTQTMHLYTDTDQRHWYLSQSSQPLLGSLSLTHWLSYSNQEFPGSERSPSNLQKAGDYYQSNAYSYIAVFAQVKMFSPVLELVDIYNSHTKELLNYAASVEGIVG